MVRKITLFAALFIGCIAFMNAQAFQEDFTGTTTSGAGSLTDLGWTVYNQDGQTANAQVSFIDEAWKLVNFSDVGEVMVTTSYFQSTGVQSDRWAVTPQISLPATNPSLFYKVLSGDPSAPEAYEILVSTTGNTPADFTDAAVISENPAPSNGGMTDRSASLADYAGQDVYIAFHSIGTDGYLLAVDDILVTSVPDRDLELEAVNVPSYVVSGNVQIGGTVISHGGNAVTAFDVTYSVDGGSPVTETVSGVNISTMGSYDFSLTTPWNATSVGEHNITVSVSNVNGQGADADTSNDMEDGTARVVSQDVTKMIVFEEGTGTWCGFCPRGIVAMEYMYDNPNQFPDFIGIAVHNQDPMMVQEYNAGAAFPGFPNSNVDRVLTEMPVSKQAWTQVYDMRKDVVAPATLEMSGIYIPSSRELTLDVDATFYTDYSASNLGLSVIVVEDGVSGTTSGYAQKNYYSDADYAGQGLSLPGFDDKPGVIPASDMVYDRVGRAIIGGYAGLAGTVPAAINDGDVASYQFIYTLPSNIDAQNTHLVALLLDKDSGAIVNAAEISLETLGVESHDVVSSFKLYPNPASQFVNVAFGNNFNGETVMNIYSLMGELVKTVQYDNIQANSTMRIDVSGLASGEYLLSFSNSNSAVVKKLIVK